MASDTWKEFERNPITHSAAHHLIAIAELLESAGYARVSDVARALNITRGSASLTLKALKQRGLVVEDENKFLQLSAEGQRVAGAVRGKKFLFESFMHNVLGVDKRVADEDTCKIEHLVSDDTARRLARFVRFITSGDPSAEAFLRAWQLFSEPCEHDPTGCPACNMDCLVELCSMENKEEGPPNRQPRGSEQTP
ncbi:MAG TPA: metal-dependent transcriptional regulator [Phycisphaerae bacterium]|nr:metal-dependent transcriptional regulator [Phycisphaerae bacterium]